MTMSGLQWEDVDGEVRLRDYGTQSGPLPEELKEPEIPSWLAPTWEAYGWLLTWAGGYGEFSAETLEAYFKPQNPGFRLEPKAALLVRRYVPWLIKEERRLAREDLERKRQQAKHSK